VPESVLETMPLARVQRHALARQYSHVVTPLIWRPNEQSPALAVLVAQLKRKTRRSAVAAHGKR
jgi:hypothetical protein